MSKTRNYYVYVFQLDYGKRSKERGFIKEIVETFPQNVLTGCYFCVNNNPYNLRLYMVLSFRERNEDFENFIREKYSHKRRIYNLFPVDFITSMQNRGYSVFSIIGINDYDMMLPPGAIFLFPEKSDFEKVWRADTIPSTLGFLCYSSKDKKIVDKLFEELQKKCIRTWYAMIEIKPGDRISQKINQGMYESNVGVVCLSKNMLASNYAEAELGYFLTESFLPNGKKLILLLLDLSPKDLPPLLRDVQCIDLSKNFDEGISKLTNFLQTIQET